MTDESFIPVNAGKHCDGCKYWKKLNIPKGKEYKEYKRCTCEEGPHSQRLTGGLVFCGRWEALVEV
jgi:hypothetical protein